MVVNFSDSKTAFQSWINTNNMTCPGVCKDEGGSDFIKAVAYNAGGPTYLINPDKTWKRTTNYASETDLTSAGLKAHVCGSDQLAPTVSVTAPASGAQLKVGEQQAVTWTATDNVGVVSRAIYFTSNNGTSWTKVDSAATNTGTYQWTVPNNVSTTCKIRVYAYDAAKNRGEALSAQFSIVLNDQEAPAVSVTSPASGAQLNAGTQQAITWTATDNVGVVSRAIYFSSNNGTSYTKVDSVLGNTGSYNWTVPSQASTTCKIRIYAYDAAGNRGTGLSANFTITATGIIFNNKLNIPIAEKYKVTIMNIQGKEVAKFEAKNLNEIEKIKNDLPSGVHVINISTGDKMFVSKFKIVE